MTQQIRTKWHKILPLIDQDEVYLTAPQGSKSVHWSRFAPKVPLLKTFLAHVGMLVPTFVVADELQQIVRTERFQLSLLDMKKAGVLRLPFPAMLVEFNTMGGRGIVLLRDNSYTDVSYPWEGGRGTVLHAQYDIIRNKPFYGIIHRIEKDADGEYLILSPGVHSISIEETCPTVVNENTTTIDNEGEAPWLNLGAATALMFASSKSLDELLQSTQQKDGSLLWMALASAMLIMNTEGVSREVIDCEKINRTRGTGSNKPPIPRHTYLHIGKVYRSAQGDASDEYVPRKSPIPHWRRGHNRTVHHGKGNAQIKTVFINPRLVAARASGDDLPIKKEYHVVK